MTLYWERCEICGRHVPTSLVTFYGRELKICYRCSFLFNVWTYRGEQAWKRPAYSEEKESDFEKKIRAIEKMLEEKKE